MKMNRFVVLGIGVILMAVMLACGFSASTANIKDATIAREVNGSAEATTSFAPDEIFYCLVNVANAPEDTVTKAAWYAVDVPGVDPNFLIDETEIAGGGDITFDLSNDQYWPDGIYKVEIYLDGELDRTLEFSVSSSF
jgi:hypothetical protein